MSRRKRGRDIHGIVLLDKPAGISSNQALQKVRRLFDARKAGHTGNLDPFATGMLPLCLGEATKTAAFMLDADKVYRAGAMLGIATATGDTEGDIVRRADVPERTVEQINAVLREFQGKSSQVPPMYSALKHAGRPLYKLAREGLEVERPARAIFIHRITLNAWDPPVLDFEVHCSKGTYVRTLAEDIGKALGSCAHLVSLRRLSVQPFGPDRTVTLRQLEQAEQVGELDKFLQPVDAGLPDWAVVTLGEETAEAFRHGNARKVADRGGHRVRVYGPEEQILGLGEIDEHGILQPRRVFNLKGIPSQREEPAAGPGRE
jgi:tRNA pseudouridine55 synthase